MKLLPSIESGSPPGIVFPNWQISIIVCATATAGLRQAPDLEPEIQIIAKRVKATARQAKNPSFVGDVLPSFTTKLMVTKTKVQMISI